MAPASSGANELGVETPPLEGPDQLELGPLVAISASGIAFDHEPVDDSGLEPRLLKYRTNFAILHPGEAAPHDVLLACSPSVSSHKILSVLDTARRSGFDHARLVFENTRGRPSTGTEKAPNRLTAARVSLIDGVGPEGLTSYIPSSEALNCAELSERVIRFRRAGQTVTLGVRASH